MTDLPGYERPAVDGELCESQGAHLRTPADDDLADPLMSAVWLCDDCERWKPIGDGWCADQVWSVCPECVGRHKRRAGT